MGRLSPGAAGVFENFFGGSGKAAGGWEKRPAKAVDKTHLPCHRTPPELDSNYSNGDRFRRTADGLKGFVCRDLGELRASGCRSDSVHQPGEILSVGKEK
ncbi:non-ribosomal peptide synthetase/polyketide synthase [Anopheles sinensis]|uniref:Non-ribosomal peptide synthetase/polyketide synthase n=1 Tax=Anopheles sinensis TaxID=74873 RepID=A0A084VHP8_ANOSI|nr:non-ribosomal peptide synthetase/polyketide synthase [Anopheles sinensis]